MNGSIERLRHLPRLLRLAATRPIIPTMMILVVGVRPSDQKHRETGYGGMIPLPAPATAPSTTARIDPLLEPRRDERAERGRVLYADGHGARVTEQTARASRKQTCPNQRLVQGRTNPAPNS